MGQFGAATPVTNPADMQAIIGARWINSAAGPIIKGGGVSGRGDLKYQFAAGAAVVPTAFGGVEVNWPAGQTALVTTPSVARTDVVYVDAAGLVAVAAGVAQPANTATLDKRVLNAGATATTASTSTWNKRYALPYGASLGWLSMFVETYTQGAWAIQEAITWTTATVFVPTDRNVTVRMHQCIFGDHNPAATDFANFGAGAMRYTVYVDGVEVRAFELPYDRRYTVVQHEVDLELTSGQHVVRVDRAKTWGAAPKHFGDAGNVWQPGSVGVADMGVRE